MKFVKRTISLFFIIFASLSLIFQPATAQTDDPLAIVLTAEGPIMPPMLEYFRRGIETAEREDAEVLVIELNTPGGSVSTTLKIIELIDNSRVPVVIYVSPPQAQAASAGAFITMAGDAAAMAPRTIIGAASPISGSGENLGSDARAKAVNDLKAVVRVNVERRGEEALALAESMVEEAVAVTANEALEIGLVDFIAEDTEDLLQLLNGFSLQVRGEAQVLNTEDIRVRPLEMSFIESLLLLLTDPNISFLLIAIGVQAILIEISSPGGWVAGFIGVVCLTLAIYGVGVLPVNWFGIIFIILAFVLFILEINAPTHGALTAAGVASFIVGALVLFNSPGTPDFLRVSVPLVIATGLGIGLLFFAVLLFAIRALRAPISSGAESFAGKIGIVTGWGDSGGQVQLQSELWSADATDDSKRIRKGDKVEVVEVRGLRLKVRKIK